jgi:hypothetical protein
MRDERPAVLKSTRDDPSSPVVHSSMVALRFWPKLRCIGFGGPTGQIAIFIPVVIAGSLFGLAGKILFGL